MATIVPTGVQRIGAGQVNEVILTGSDSFTYATGDVLVLRNPTAGSISPSLVGAAAPVLEAPGIPAINLAVGHPLGAIAAGQMATIDLDTIKAYLVGALTVQNGAGLVASILRRTAPNTAEPPIIAWAPDTVDAANTTAVTQLWAGHTTDSAFTASVKLASSSTEARLVVSPNADLSGTRYVSAPVASDGLYAKATVSGLPPDTALYWGMALGSTLYRANVGRLRTDPAPGAASFRIAFGNCHTGVTSEIFTILNGLTPRPRRVLHLGDLHYQDIEVNDQSLYAAALDSRFGGTFLAMARDLPTVWTWSDHDYGADGSDTTNPGRDAHLAVYRRQVPHPPLWLTAATDPIGYSFVMGRCRFIVPDQRSRLVKFTDQWGAAQRTRILQEITDAATAGQFVFFVSDVSLSNFEFNTVDRTLLADHVRDEGMIGRIAVLHGDAHAIQFDDGRNHDFATGGGVPIAQVCCGPFSQANSVKGGPYSHGTFSISTRQAGLLDITDSGGATIQATVTAIRETGATIATFPLVLGTGWTAVASALAPENTALPTISGTAQVGQTLTASNGTWSNSPTGYTYQWRRDGVNIAGATAQTYAQVLADLGATITVRVTASNANGPGWATSAAVGPVIAAAASSISIVRSATAQAALGAGARSVTLGAAPTPGNRLLAFVAPDKASGVTVPAGWTALGTPHTAGTGISLAVLTKIADGSETTTSFTISNAAGSASSILMLELAGSAAVDLAVYDATNASTTARTTGAMGGTTGFANELAIAFFANDSASTTAAATGFAFSGGFVTQGSVGIGAAATVSTAPAMAWATLAVPASGTVLSTTASYDAGTGSSDECLGALITLRP